ncbi:MAG TPA: PRC-barrel domain-containing protein [Chthoniobacterales bacterium]|jgi:uncharacterized protein YrrD
MIRANQLVGRAVVDMDAAERLGHIKEIIVDREGHHVAGFVVARGESIFGGGTRRIIPASALHVIGPDAITIRGSAIKENTDDLKSLPRVSDIIGRKMVTQSGRLLGSIGDVLIDRGDGEIIGFSISEGARGKLEGIFGGEKAHVTCYVRADADLQVGNDLIVVPDDSLVQLEATQTQASPAADKVASTQAAPQGWGTTRSPSDRRSAWTKRNAVSESPTPSGSRPAGTPQPPDPNRPIVLPQNQDQVSRSEP